MAEPSFTRDIKPRFEAVKAGTMPCDEKWSADAVDLFARWIAGGMVE